MERFVNCIAHKSSDGKLLIGSDKTALFDCGMLFCADKTIANVEAALGGRGLDYLFFSHTHYDHIGALPMALRRWPEARVLTSSVGAAVLQKDTPRRVFRELSLKAAQSFGDGSPLPAYDDDVFHADITLSEGDVTDLGGLSVVAIETPGHTRDSLSFFVPELELLLLCETTGVLLPDGSVLPCYLTSYNDTIASIERCGNVDYRRVCLPHDGIIEYDEARGFFEKSKAANEAYRNFIVERHEKGVDNEGIVESLFDVYSNEAVRSMQPMDAFFINAHAAINSTLRELG